MIIGDSTSRIRSGQVDVVAEAWPTVRGRYPVIYNHSAASDAREQAGWSLPSTRPITKALVDKLKFNIVGTSAVSNLGAAGLPAGSAVGNPIHRGAVADAVAYHTTTYDSSGDIGMYGTSQGTASSLVYALEHPGTVRWMVLLSPVPLLKEYEADNFGVGTANLDISWACTIHNMPAKADLYTRIMAGELAGVPILWIDSSDDGYSHGPYATKYNQLVAATGGLRQALGAVGHGDGTSAAANIQGIIDFIQEHN
jgi:pimeloyl-ACP methyl ester carboxylesterase